MGQLLIQYIYLKHFETECFALEGSSYRDAVGIPAKKRLKPDTLPTRYLNSQTESQSMVIAGNGSSDPSQRQTSERRKRISVSKLMQNASSTHGYYKSTILPIDIFPQHFPQHCTYGLRIV